MPNWCQNELTISGNEEEIKLFRKKTKITKKTKIVKELFSKLFPCPKELYKEKSPPDVKNKILFKKYKAYDWHEWCIKNWGIKWDINLEIEDEEKDYLEFDFPSPWGPPIEAFTKISKDFPNLTFRIKYDEPGMGFFGRAIIKNGKCNDKYIED